MLWSLPLFIWAPPSWPHLGLITSHPLQYHCTGDRASTHDSADDTNIQSIAAAIVSAVLSDFRGCCQPWSPLRQAQHCPLQMSILLTAESPLGTLVYVLQPGRNHFFLSEHSPAIVESGCALGTVRDLGLHYSFQGGHHSSRSQRFSASAAQHIPTAHFCLSRPRCLHIIQMPTPTHSLYTQNSSSELRAKAS